MWPKHLLFGLLASASPACALRPAPRPVLLRAPAAIGRVRAEAPPLLAPAASSEGTATIPVSTLNLVKSIVGSGVLSLPVGIAAYSSSRLGVIPALALMATIGGLSAYTFTMIGRVCEATGSATWGEAWAATVGKPTAWVPRLSVAILCFSASIQYTMVLGDTFSVLGTAAGLPPALASRTGAIALVTALGTLPLSLLPSLELLKYTSLLGIGGILYTAAFMAKRVAAYGAGSALHAAVAPALRPSFDRVAATTAQSFGAAFGSSKVFVLVSMLATSFCAHFLAPQFYNDLSSAGKESKTGRYAALTAAGFILSALISATVMVAGFLTFGASSNGYILNNYAAADALAQAARVAIGGALVCTYPFLLTGLRDNLMETLGTPRVPTTLAAVALVTGIGARLTNLGTVAAVSGALLSTSIVYTLPALMFGQLLAKRTASAGKLSSMGFQAAAPRARDKLELLGARAITVLGVGLTAIGMKAALG